MKPRYLKPRYVPRIRPMSRRAFLKHSALGLAGSLLAAGSLSGCEFLEDDSGIYDVIVVGGGVSGLTAAWLMRGENVLLLEKEPVPGGRVINRTWEQFNYSMGAAYTGKPDLDMSLFYLELGVNPIPVPPPVDAIAYNGIIYPDDYAANALGSLAEFRDYARVSQSLYELSEEGIEDAIYEADIDSLAEFEEYDQLSIGQWLDDEGIGPMVQRYINVENRGLFGASNDDISLLFDTAEMAFNLYEGELTDADYETGPVPDFATYQPDVDESDSEIWTLENGMIDLVWAMERKLEGRVRSGAEVTSVNVDGDGTVSVTYTQNGASHTVRAYAAILATPAAVTASIVKSGLSNVVMEALRAVPYTTYVTMAIFLSERLFRNAWNIACLDTPFTTLNDAIRTQVARDYDGRSILGVAMPPERADDRSLIAMSDDALLERALADVERYFPDVRSKVLGKDVHRFQYAFPVFRPGYGEILWELHKDATTMGPLFLAGDYMIYPTLGGAAVSAYRAYDLVAEYADTMW